ncbi:OmpA family protein [Luteibacter sp.]|jgi:OOP family OmpA-OmpF porin|uniref:OmpA family protein n=1 Tax=Luteibacter sp. TaxID=1886636 RepID=UPI002F3F02E2
MSRLIPAMLFCSLFGTMAQATTDRPVIAEGLVPDEATRADILRRLRQVYPDTPVVDRIEVGPTEAPANWSRYVGQAIGPNLRHVEKGDLNVEGNAVSLTGSVRDDAIRTATDNELKSAFNATYRVTTALSVDDMKNRQEVLDRTLGNRTVQFESGSAVLTPAGVAILNQMAAAIAQVGTPSLDIIGHTDAAGDRQTNILLSMARADAVKAYLVSKGIGQERLLVSGRGPDQAIDDNGTQAGRARNRRIEFTIRN